MMCIEYRVLRLKEGLINVNGGILGENVVDFVDFWWYFVLPEASMRNILYNEVPIVT